MSTEDKTAPDGTEVRAFGSAAEVRALPGFKEDNPVSPKTYDKLIGHYDLPEEDFRCCYVETADDLCHEPHKWGFVAKLKDTSITVLGNHCARTKFARDAEGFKRDLARYENQRERLEAFDRLQVLLSEKDARLARLRAMKQQVEALTGRMRAELNRYGTKTQLQIAQMARTDRPTVSVMGLRRRPYTDQNGAMKVEETKVPIALGRIAGLKLLQVGALALFLDKFAEIETAYRRAAEATAKTRTTELKQLGATISNGDGLVPEGQSFLDLEGTFKANDRSLFCFLTDDRDERLRAAVIAVRLDGTSDRDRAAWEWLIEKEREIRQEAVVDALQII
ncbi:MAG TPA: hypothetical protein VM240_05455 [Verrucomicrobiae bacterium]|nr:hypothetical protein [Verrucomicrobiae bacterium]